MILVNRTVAISAQPMGRPGWPELAFSTASMERERMALAIASAVLELGMKSALVLENSGRKSTGKPASSEAGTGLTGSVCLSMTGLYSAPCGSRDLRADQ